MRHRLDKTLVALLCLALGACGSSGPTLFDNPKVGIGIVESINQTGAARVFVALVPPPSLDSTNSNPVQVRGDIARIQAGVIATLDANDFRNQQLFTTVPAMVGTITTVRSLAVLVSHPSVLRVDLDAGGTGSR